MKIRRYGAAVAVAAAGALLFSACTTSDNPKSTETGTTAAAKTGGTVTVAEVNQFTSFNPNTPQGALELNQKIWTATNSSFNYVDDDLKIQKDTSFGTYEVTSQDPLTVKYTISKDATWSDGVPVTADDMLLAWAVVSGYYDDAKFDANGEVVSGTQYFTFGGTTLPDFLTKVPTISDDDKTITVEYAKPYADWEIALSSPLVPAHVVWKKAGIADAAGFQKLLQDTPKGDPAKPAKPNAQLQKMGTTYNTGFDSKSLPSDPSLYLSDGPYIVSAIDPGKSVTLIANKSYKGAHTPKLDSIVMRTIGDSQAQIQALQNGEVDIISPQAGADTLSALEGVSGAQVHKGNQLAYDHVDLKMNGVFKDKNVREAFLKTIPRQAILDSIITPLDSSAKVLNSQIFVPGQDGYDQTIAENGSSAYGEPDIEGAKKLLAGKTPTIDILYNSENPNRVDAFTLIADSAKKAGFKIKNDGDPKWSTRLPSDSYDASIFGWINPGAGVAGVPQLFQTGQGGNYTHYSNETVDQLSNELLVTSDKTKQISLEQQIDKQLFADAFGLPLFQSVGVDAESGRVQGIDKFNPTQTGVWWNVWDWSVKS